MNKKVVIALGGNALIKEGQEGSIEEQRANASEVLNDVVELIKKGYKILITHGNGPQVGAIMIRSESALDKTYDIPLSTAVAQSQGEIGSIITETLSNELKNDRIKRDVEMILTHVICDKNDPALKKPTKPIGPFHSTPEVFKKRGIDFIEDANRGYRRVVPSPMPLDIVEKKVIKTLVDKGTVVVAGGGGGIPVYFKRGKMKTIEGVVDKDFTTYLLAKFIKADQIFFLTYVEKVALNFGKSNQEWLDKITVKEAKQYLKEGHFLVGSMKPKIESTIKFLESGGERVIITSVDKVLQAVKGKTGTWITK